MTLEQVAKELDMKLEEALDRVVNKRELLIRLLKVYVNGEYMDNARAAMRTKDYKTVESNVHSLKGSGASLGLQVMADACHQVVAAVREQRFGDVEELFAKADAEYERTKELIEQIGEME